MKRTRNFLIIEDHFAMVEGYKSILNFLPETDVSFIVAYNCEQAEQIILDGTIKFELALLDINLPASKNIKSGEEVALLLRKTRPSTKILILTSFVEKLSLYNINKKLCPEGFLVKSDFTPEELILAVNNIMDGRVSVYSKTVLNCVNEINGQITYLDEFNRKILSMLSQGYKSKSLANEIPLSQSAIDKRKSGLKEFFGIKKGNDEDIIREAKRIGLI